VGLFTLFYGAQISAQVNPESGPQQAGQQSLQVFEVNPADQSVSVVSQLATLHRFLQAAQIDDVSVLGRLGQLGLTIDTRDELGNNLLMLAIREGAQELTLAMLLNPAWYQLGRLEQTNKLGETPMMLAALKGNLVIARRLIELGAQTNRAGWGPLHYAATSGHAEMINLLVEHFAYLDAQSPNGTTALMMAVRFNHRVAAERLIALGADSTLKNESGMTARAYAAANNQPDTAFWLEMEEIAFTNRYLRNVPKIDVDAIFKDPAAPAAPVGATPGVEVIPGIQ
jgi:uncharacterized protein